MRLELLFSRIKHPEMLIGAQGCETPRTSPHASYKKLTSSLKELLHDEIPIKKGLVAWIDPLGRY